MTASAGSRPGMSNLGPSTSDYGFRTTMDGLAGQRIFKKHKVLPHPRRELNISPSDPRRYGVVALPMGVDRPSPRHSSSPLPSPTLKHQPRRIGSGPDLPPTPPAHSRNSSSSQSLPRRGISNTGTHAGTAQDILHAPPTTPGNQQSPPTPNLTPERTPPGPADRRPLSRPAISDRVPSKATTESRTESFKTARENPYSSDEEYDGKSSLRHITPSNRTSQTTVRRISAEIGPSPVGLGLSLESRLGGDLTPRAKKEFIAFDGEWGSESEVEQQWDDHFMRNVTVKKRRSSRKPPEDEVFDELTVTPTNATRVLRSRQVEDSPLSYPQSRVVSEPIKPKFTIPSSTSSSSMDLRRLSGVSTKSTVSTVVEAFLVDTPPQRRKTLRHVRKQVTLRGSISNLSPTSSAPTSAWPDDSQRQPRIRSEIEPHRNSVVSSTTYSSVSSRKARREVWRNGGIPVVVIPDRRGSVKSGSQEPSLRSTSSRRSARSQSLSSVPLSHVSQSKDLTPYFERPRRRGRPLSESDGSHSGDIRTIDYPPVIPKRSSSLSAPTSRNTSRAGSLTAGSLKAHNTFYAQQAREISQKLSVKASEEQESSRNVDRHPADEAPRAVNAERSAPNVTVQPATSFESHKPERDPHLLDPHVDRHGDPFFGRRLSAQNTPFSLASVETTGTSHAEVSEAMAVTIYPHQNKSLLLVDHSNKPSESSSSEQVISATTPQIRTSNPEETGPVTPPQPILSMDDVDSPLTNPRAPPEPPAPPAIAFIPATPSGLTPAAEKDKQLGNFYESKAQRPSRPQSLLRRTLGRRRYSDYGSSAPRNPGILARTFSLSRNVRRDTADNVEADKGKAPMISLYPNADDRPADENRLHPFWRPANSDYSGDEDDWVHDTDHEETYRYPLVDNRPRPPRRSLSTRVKKALAILPIRDDYFYHYDEDEPDGTTRRTIRRTPSGNLRVVKHRTSLDSLGQPKAYDGGRPYTAPEDDSRANGVQRFWRSNSISFGNGYYRGSSAGDTLTRRPSTAKSMFSGFGNTIEKYGLHNLPRRMSERKREKRSRELRQKISGPRDVRDGVGDVLKRKSHRNIAQQPANDI